MGTSTCVAHVVTARLALDDIFEHLSQRVPFAATPIRREARVDLAALP
jgi:hypothetical protein